MDDMPPFLIVCFLGYHILLDEMQLFRLLSVNQHFLLFSSLLVLQVVGCREMEVGVDALSAPQFLPVFVLGGFLKDGLASIVGTEGHFLICFDVCLHLFFVIDLVEAEGSLGIDRMKFARNYS